MYFPGSMEKFAGNPSIFTAGGSGGGGEPLRHPPFDDLKPEVLGMLTGGGHNSSLRFGLPGEESDWARLDQAFVDYAKEADMTYSVVAGHHLRHR